MFNPSKLAQDLKSAVTTEANNIAGVFHGLNLGKRSRYIAPALLLGAAPLVITYPDQALATLNQSVGAIGALLAARAPAHQDNNHTRAQMMVGQAVFATHLCLIEAWSAATVSGVTALRCAAQGMLPETSSRTKTAVGAAGFALATAFYSKAFGFQSIWSWDTLPFATMALASVAETMPRDKSSISRMLYAQSAGVQVAYHTLSSGSWAGMILNSYALYKTGKAIRDYDWSDKKSPYPGTPPATTSIPEADRS